MAALSANEIADLKAGGLLETSEELEKAVNSPGELTDEDIKALNAQKHPLKWPKQWQQKHLVLRAMLGPVRKEFFPYFDFLELERKGPVFDEAYGYDFESFWPVPSEVVEEWDRINASVREVAEPLKLQGNERFKAGDYKGALELYAKAGVHFRHPGITRGQVCQLLSKEVSYPAEATDALELVEKFLSDPPAAKGAVPPPFTQRLGAEVFRNAGVCAVKLGDLKSALQLAQLVSVVGCVCVCVCVLREGWGGQGG